MRVFLAINLPPPERARIARACAPVRAAGPAVAWVPAERLHLTLKFLGDITRESADRVTEAVHDAVGAHRALTIQIGGVGAFPNFRRAQVVWVGVQPDPKLELLHHAVEIACSRVGHAVAGRPFRPHITLGRLRADAGDSERRAIARAAAQVRLRAEGPVDAVDVMESHVAGGAPRYTLIASARLGLTQT